MGIGTLRRHHTKASTPAPVTEPEWPEGEEPDDQAPEDADATPAPADADETPVGDETAPADAPDAPTPQTDDSAVAEPAAPLERPKGNASLEAWTAYALENGYTADDLADAGRDQIAALFKD